MKLVYAIVQNDDSKRLLRELTNHRISVTRISSTGGFLHNGNSTLMIGVEATKGIHGCSLRSTRIYRQFPRPCTGDDGRCNGICCGRGAILQVLERSNVKRHQSGGGMAL